MARIQPPGFKIVPQHVSRNLVTRAFQRIEQRRAAIDYQVYLHTLQEGDDAVGDVLAAGTVLLVAWRCCRAGGQVDSVHAREIRAGIAALETIAVAGYVWRTRHIEAVDLAMQRAVEVYDSCPATIVQQQYFNVQRDVEARGQAVVHTSSLEPAP